MAGPAPAAIRRARPPRQSAPSVTLRHPMRQHAKLARFDARKAHRASDPSPPSTRYYSGSEMDDRREPFGMPFANRELAVIIANELNRHDRGIWFYTVERQIEGKRWIIVRGGRELDFVKRHCELRQARDA